MEHNAFGPGQCQPIPVSNVYNNPSPCIPTNPIYPTQPLLSTHNVYQYPPQPVQYMQPIPNQNFQYQSHSYAISYPPAEAEQPYESRYQVQEPNRNRNRNPSHARNRCQLHVHKKREKKKVLDLTKYNSVGELQTLVRWLGEDFHNIRHDCSQSIPLPPTSTNAGNNLDSKSKSQNPDTYLWSCKSCFKYKDTQYRAEGIGASKKNAKREASKKLIKKILDTVLPFDLEIINEDGQVLFMEKFSTQTKILSKRAKKNDQVPSDRASIKIESRSGNDLNKLKKKCQKKSKQISNSEQHSYQSSYISPNDTSNDSDEGTSRKRNRRKHRSRHWKCHHSHPHPHPHPQYLYPTCLVPYQPQNPYYYPQPQYSCVPVPVPVPNPNNYPVYHHPQSLPITHSMQQQYSMQGRTHLRNKVHIIDEESDDISNLHIASKLPTKGGPEDDETKSNVNKKGGNLNLNLNLSISKIDEHRLHESDMSKSKSKSRDDDDDDPDDEQYINEVKEECLDSDDNNKNHNHNHNHNRDGDCDAHARGRGVDNINESSVIGISNHSQSACEHESQKYSKSSGIHAGAETFKREEMELNNNSSSHAVQITLHDDHKQSQQRAELTLNEIDEHGQQLRTGERNIAECPPQRLLVLVPSKIEFQVIKSMLPKKQLFPFSKKLCVSGFVCPSFSESLDETESLHVPGEKEQNQTQDQNQNQINRLYIVHCGTGLVNVSLAVASVVQTLPIDSILLLGSAISLHKSVKPGHVMIPTLIVQHDLYFRSVSNKSQQYFTSEIFSNWISTLIADGQENEPSPSIYRGTLLSGSEIVGTEKRIDFLAELVLGTQSQCEKDGTSDDKEPEQNRVQVPVVVDDRTIINNEVVKHSLHGIAVDREAAAIAMICKKIRTPFAVLKSIIPPRIANTSDESQEFDHEFTFDCHTKLPIIKALLRAYGILSY